jgi:hypothetical protein
MRTKNKMKNSKVEFEEWWEVAKEYLQRSWRIIWFSIQLIKEFKVQVGRLSKEFSKFHLW